MIFVVTGTTEFPFNRLIEMVNRAVETGLITEEVVVQSGAFSGDAPSLTLIPYIEKEQFDRYFQEASLIISHTGIGVMLAALEYNKPLFLMPRRAEFGEHVNDHQVDTALALAGKSGVRVFESFEQLENLFCEYKTNVFSKEKVSFPTDLAFSLEVALQGRSCVATASAGGHMVELLQLLNYLDFPQVEHFISTHELQRISLEKRATTSIVGECNRKTPFRMIKVFFQTAKLAKKLKPKVVISTGALPSAFFCYHAHRKGADIIWIDSIANVRELSMSGRFVKKFATASFTQWENLADEKTLYKGSLL